MLTTHVLLTGYPVSIVVMQHKAGSVVHGDAEVVLRTVMFSTGVLKLSIQKQKSVVHSLMTK